MAIFRNPDGSEDEPKFVGTLDLDAVASGGIGGPGSFRVVVEGDDHNEVSDKLMEVQHAMVNEALDRKDSDSDLEYSVHKLREEIEEVDAELPTDF